MSTKTKLSLEKLYDLVNNEEDARICKDIPDSACQYTPKNYFVILFSNTLTKLGDTLSNPKTVLAWIMNYINAPVFLISFIVPIRESGSMLPQILIANYIRKLPVRKWIWVIGSILQAIALVGMGFTALNYSGTLAGWLIVGLLVVFSLSRGLCSVASKDVLGKTIPKTRRGTLKGYTVSVSGVLVLVAGLYLLFKSEEESTISFYSYILFFAASLWIIAALIYSFIFERKGETDGGANGFTEAISKLKLIKTDTQFRNFVISRSLLLCSALTAPYYVVLAQQHTGTESYILGLFIISNGIASIISAPIWGKMADRSSKDVMSKAALVTAILGILVFIIVTWIPTLKTLVWTYPIAFFILGIAHSGVRLGRKTYIVDMAGGNKRTDYVAVSNTLIGFILLVTGSIGALASTISTEGIILVLSLLGLVGAYKSYQLPNVE
ncbi:MFS transporter [Aquimarina brevivitae]|uniref:MFS transporter n=1 Tax=Aquimarina brevivitae TaxID=323412 RepID=A0A4Q7NZT5_9FLAO|nr:MFS transporter [Aquimarina brevivitae]RZS91882.1 MFS transporter [Aquimarina brevivitae]